MTVKSVSARLPDGAKFTSNVALVAPFLVVDYQNMAKWVMGTTQ